MVVKSNYLVPPLFICTLWNSQRDSSEGGVVGSMGGDRLKNGHPSHSPPPSFNLPAAFLLTCSPPLAAIAEKRVGRRQVGCVKIQGCSSISSEDGSLAARVPCS